MDDALRNSLWNVLQTIIFSELDGYTWVSDQPGFRIIQAIWLNFFKRPLDELHGHWPTEKKVLRNWFFGAEWYKVYDLLEFLAKLAKSQPKQRIIELSNVFLERELSAFRFIDDELTRISRDVEIESVEVALRDTSALVGVNGHLRAALGKLGDRTDPDYRNSIKESICAVEALCQLLTSDPSATLGSALKQLGTSNVEVHPALEKAWLAIYGYTSDKGGIRHAMLDEPTLTQADARYMLVSCSAFVSYLVDLSARAGLKLV